MPKGGKFIKIHTWAIKPKWIKLNEETKIIASVITKELKPRIKVFWFHSVNLPSLDSICNSFTQSIKLKSRTAIQKAQNIEHRIRWINNAVIKKGKKKPLWGIKKEEINREKRKEEVN